VLDLGCGAGTDIEALLKLGTRLTAADFSADAVRMVQKAFGDYINVDCFDMREGLPYQDGYFDTLVSDLSLHYFTWADTEKIVSELERILVSGGVLVARLHSIDNLDAGIVGEELEKNYYVAYGFSRRYFTTEDILKLFDKWEILHLEKSVAHRYGREKKVIEFVTRRL